MFRPYVRDTYYYDFPELDLNPPAEEPIECDECGEVIGRDQYVGETPNGCRYCRSCAEGHEIMDWWEA